MNIRALSLSLELPQVISAVFRMKFMLTVVCITCCVEVGRRNLPAVMACTPLNHSS